jgi:hypothetical protein
MVDGSFPSNLPISVNEAPSLRETSIVALSSRVRCVFFAMVFSPWKHAIRTLVLNYKYTIPEWFARVISGSNFAILNSGFGLNGLEFKFSIQPFH